MNPYMDECTHYIYGFGQPCLILLASCIRIAYHNYNVIEINKALINNYFDDCFITTSYNNNNNNNNNLINL